jgi:F0F1-type ATP synthase alpha subunit
LPNTENLQCLHSSYEDVDDATRSLLNRGVRLVELLKQPQFAPLNVENQIISLFTGVKGYLDLLDVQEISNFESDFLQLFVDNPLFTPFIDGATTALEESSLHFAVIFYLNCIYGLA